jgi:hypothetical protein
MRQNSFFFFLFLLLSVSAVIYGQELEAKFNAAESEMMAVMFNQFSIKGSDVEAVVPLNRKLKEALQKSQGIQNKNDSVPLKLTTAEVSICLTIINNSTFEARFTELVFGMKQKLLSLLPARENALPPTSQEIKK